MRYFILAVIILSSCSSNNNSDPQQDNVQLLVNKKWKISAISGKLLNGTMIPDDYTGLPDYKKDDYLFFNPNLTFTWNANTIKKPLHPEDILDQGTWAIVNADRLQLQSSSTTYFPTKILSINATTLKLESTESDNVIWSNYTAIP